MRLFSGVRDSESGPPRNAQTFNEMPADPRSLLSQPMDFRTSPPAHLQLGVNGSRGTAQGNSQNHCGSFEDEALQFLSQEERECILFLEQTIDSLDHGLEGPDSDWFSGSSTPVEDRSTTPSLVPVTGKNQTIDAMDQDVIDLVGCQTEPVGVREVQHQSILSATHDFRTIAVNPEIHTEMKAKRGPRENLPLPSPSSPPSLGSNSIAQSLYHPVGSIPTPVIIAQKLTEHQRGSGSSPLLSAILSGRRKSLGCPSPSSSFDHPTKQGPPTTAKPTRYPSNINLATSNKDYCQSNARESVNSRERKEEMLAHLMGAVESDGNSVRKVPTRSISFRDLTPDKSRMEALSKLGLPRDRVSSVSNGSRSLVITPSLMSTNKAKPTLSNANNFDSKRLVAVPSIGCAAKMDTSASDYNSYGGKTKVITPLAVSSTTTDVPIHTSQHESRSNMASTLLRTSATKTTEAYSFDFKSYGGKTNVITPGLKIKSDVTTQHSGNYENKPSVASPASSGNSSGVKNKVTSSSLVAHSIKPTTRTETVTNNGRGKPEAVIPATASTTKPKTSPSYPGLPVSNCRQPSSRSDPQSSVTFPRRSWGPSSQVRSASPEAPRRSFSRPKTSFRPQGITVQFSGRGATDESRREALRKLGLLKETS